MRKTISAKQQTKFSYENCIQGHVNDKKRQYLATVNEHFISLRSWECEKVLKTTTNPLGWKFHISIDDEEQNLIHAWNVIAPILIENKINFAKFMRPQKDQSDETRQNYERGRQFTIYIEQNPEKTTEDWQRLINVITDQLVLNNIKPGYKNTVAKAVPGSSYFYYRNDKRASPRAEATEVIAASPAKSDKPQQISDNISRSDPPSARIESSSLPSASPLPEQFSPPLANTAVTAADPVPLTPPSSTLAIKSAQTGESHSLKAGPPKKPLMIPKLNLPNSAPAQTWTKVRAATAKEIYLDNSIEKKYNPSNSEESFLLPLRVDSAQPAPKEHPQLTSLTK